MKTDLVLFSSLTGDGLSCPRCEGGFLHHHAVRVFDRSEDEEQVAVTEVVGCLVQQSVERSQDSDNPSDRRHGLAISFYCEECSDDADPQDTIELTLSQHKGATLVGWRYTARKLIKSEWDIGPFEDEPVDFETVGQPQ